MNDRREVHISIGKREYRIQTDLDDSDFGRVREIVDEIAGSLGSKLEQDQLLLLTCLQLAYNMEKVSGTLAQLSDRLENLPPWEPEPAPKEPESGPRA